MLPRNPASIPKRYAVILAGGKGERFWPYSRIKTPKHLLCLAGADTLIQQTLERLEGVVLPENIYIITHESQKEAIALACPGLSDEQIIAEPLAKDTAPAIALALVMIQQKDPQASLLVLPADQKIEAMGSYQAAIEAAFSAAEDYPVIVTFGVKPSFPATGYGYIRKGPFFKTILDHPIYAASAFVEKPDIAKAKSYLAKGYYFWNTGFFVFRASTLRRAYEQTAPKLYAILEAIEADLKVGEPLNTVLKKHYPRFEKLSIDYALMEKASNILMIEATFDWDDMGSWLSLERHCQPDSNNNTLQGLNFVHECHNNIIVSDPRHLVGALGVDNMIVVHTPDATLICPKHKSEKLKELMKLLAEDERFKPYL